MAFGNTKTAEEKTAIVKQVFHNFGFYLADFLLSYELDVEGMRRKVRIENDDVFRQLRAEGQPVILITAHHCNWELIPKALGSHYGHFVGVGEKLRNSPKLTEMLNAYRAKHQVTMLPKRGAYRGMVRALKAGEVLGLVIDQNTSEKEAAIINFFGHPARHTPSVARLARKTGAVVIPAFIHTRDHRSYTLRFEDPLIPPVSDDEEADILAATQLQASITEKIIRENPTEYFWFHQRFKGTFPHIYR